MKFILTNELGRLAKWLRILGFDALYYEKDDKAALAVKSLREDRIILTRDSKMSRFTGMRMVHIETDFVEDQVEQVIRDLRLKIDEAGIFTRCVDCNTILEKTEKDSVRGKVPDYVYDTQDVFLKCSSCGKVFWKGTHWDLAQKFLRRIKTA